MVGSLLFHNENGLDLELFLNGMQAAGKNDVEVEPPNGDPCAAPLLHREESDILPQSLASIHTRPAI